MDQYKNPHESKHTVSEVLGWLEKTGFKFVKSFPSSLRFKPFREDEKLFEPEPPGNWLDHLLVNFGMILSGSQEGGFFIVIAKRK
jgi:hypothetical protein